MMRRSPRRRRAAPRALRHVAAMLVLAAPAAAAQDAAAPDDSTAERARPTAAVRAARRVARRPVEIPEFAKLRTPASPAFMILGVSPTAVDRPTTPVAVAISALNSLADGVGMLPKRYAVEVAPYWVASHPSLTYSAYAHPGWRSVYRTATISVATADSTFRPVLARPTDSTISKLGVGLRTILVDGTHAADTACFARLRAALREASRVVGERVASGAIAPDDDAARLAVADSVARPAERACLERAAARRGFVLSGAAGAAFRFPGESFDAGRFAMWAVWLSPAWYTTRSSTVGVLRLSRSRSGDPPRTRVVDVGVREVYAWSRYAASMELVRRWARDSTTTTLYRAAVGFDVKLGGRVWLNTAFGRDFARGNERSLLLLANLQLSAGEPRIGNREAARLSRASGNREANRRDSGLGTRWGGDCEGGGLWGRGSIDRFPIVYTSSQRPPSLRFPMALSIKHPEADRLARELAATTGESLTDAIILALRERLERQRAKRTRRRVVEDVARIRARYRRLPLRDRRSADEILGYDDQGLPR